MVEIKMMIKNKEEEEAERSSSSSSSKLILAFPIYVEIYVTHLCDVMENENNKPCPHYCQ